MARKMLIAILIGLAAVLVAAQLLAPALVAGAVEKRLTAHGGSANVKISSFPAVRLLFGDGDRIDVTGSAITVDLQEDNRVFERLDGFDEVVVDLSDVTAGPFDSQVFRLEKRSGEPDYMLALSSSVSAREFSGYAADQLGGPLGGLIDTFAGTLPLPRGEIPVELDATVRSTPDGIELVGGTGTIAGVPATPIVEAIAGSIVSQL